MSSWKINMMRLHYQRICLLSVTICLTFICINGQCMSSNDCQNGGTCNRPNCTCAQGYTGPTCGYPPVCFSSPCNYGVCNTSSDGYRCTCYQGYTGVNCDRAVNPCENHVCQNGADCMPSGPEYYVCLCRPAHTGQFCEFLVNYTSCSPDNPCQDGECIEEGDNVYCDCTPFTGGAFCERTPSCSNRDPCRHGGTCMDGFDNSVPSSCVCTAAWTGEICEFPLRCNADTCRNGGTCMDPPATGEPATCSCTDSWEGPTCEDEVLTCIHLGCDNGGTCDGGTCICPTGYTGDFCEFMLCGSAPCFNGGSCISGMTPYCSCPVGFTGDFCETEIIMCGTDVCYNGGTCMDTGSSLYCVCPSDFTGYFCETDLSACDSDTCYNGGTCMDFGSYFYCECTQYFSGLFCEDVASVCTCSPCENGGTCVDLYPSTLSPGCTPSPDVPTPGPDDYYMCDCPSGFGGKNCEMNDPCRPNPCMNGGVCSVDNGMAMCDCTSTGFRGPVCGDNVNNPEPTPGGLTQETIGIIAGSAAAAVVIIIVVITIACCCCRRERNSDKDKLTGLEMGANNQPRRRYHDYVPSPTKTMMPAIPNLRVSKMRDETKMEFPRNRLTLLNKLGSGSFADVYKAEAYGITDKDAMTIVAVKKLKETATENDRSDLSKEISLFFFLDPHPNIVNILGCCTEADPWYIIMEYLPNGNLQGYLRQIRTGGSMAPEYKNVKKQTDIPPNDLLNFGVQIARGMEYLASRACIHRDLAARNILLGEEWVCKVSDFGLARDLEDGQTYEMKSQGRVPVRWMSPESLLHNTYTSQSDVWSFAVLIWEIVTLGSHPYPGMSSKQVVKDISAGYRLPRPEHCSQDIYDLMKECWQHDPEDRPTFSDITKKLENMLADAQGYLVMSDFNDDNYVYLEPDQHTGDTLDNEGFSHL